MKCYDSGTDADPSGETSYGLLYEYLAGCQSDEDWIGSTDGNCFRNRVKCWIFPVVQEKGKIEGFVDFLDSFKVSEYTGNIEVR